MALTAGEVQGVLRLKDEASAVLQRFRGDVRKLPVDLSAVSRVTAFKGLEQQMSRARSELDKLSDSARRQLTSAMKSGAFSVGELQRATGLSVNALKLFRKEIVETEKQAKGSFRAMLTQASAFGSFLGTLGANIATALGRVALQGIKNLAGGIIDLVKSSGQVAAIEGSFRNLTQAVGVSGDELIALTRSATKGLISDFEIMQAANKALLLGLPVTAKEMATLAQTAVVLGRAMGQEAAKSLDDLTIALGRGSPRILDNLGLIVRESEAHRAFAASVGKSTAQLTDQEKTLAFYNAAVKLAAQRVSEVGGVSLTLADRLKILGVGFDNFTTSLQIGIARSPVLNALIEKMGETLLNAFGENQAKAIDAITRGVDALALAFARFAKVILTDLDTARLTIAKFVDSTFNELILLTKLAKTTDFTGNAAKKLKELEDAQREFLRTNAEIGIAFDKAIKFTDRLERQLEEARGTTVQFNQATRRTAEESDRAAAALSEEAKALKKLVDARIDFLEVGKKPGRDALGAFADIDLTKFLVTFNEFRTITADLLKAPISTARGLFDLLNAKDLAALGVRSGKLVADNLSESFGSFLTKELPGVIVGAFKGGGSVVNAIGSAFGAELFGPSGALGRFFSASGAARGALTRTLGQTFGGAIANFVPVLGPLLGGALDKVFGFFSKREGRQVNDLRDQFVAAAGGLHELNVMAHEAGLTLDRFLRADSVKEYEAAISELQEAFRRAEEEAKAFAADLEQITAQGSLASGGVLERLLLGKDRDVGAIFGFLKAQTEQAITGIQKFVESGTVRTAGGGAALGGAVASLFAELQRQGATAADALRILEPVIDGLSAKLRDAGVTGGSAFNELRGLAALLKDEVAGPAIESVLGLSQALTGLQNAGLLNQDIFSGLSQEITETFKALQEEGKSGQEVLKILQPALQRVFELQRDFGFSVDESTQALLDQAQASGLVGDQFRSAQDQMRLAVEALIERLDALIVQLGGELPSNLDKSVSAFEGWASKAKDSVGDVADEVDRLNFGSSPGGLKEIPILLAKAADAGAGFKSQLVGQLDEADGALTTLIGRFGQLPSSAESAARGISDALNNVDFTLHGGIKFDVPNMDDLLRPVRDILSNKNSGINPGPFDIEGFATGGIVTKSTLGLVGEAGPEAVVPLSQFSGATTRQEIRVFLDGREITRAVARDLPAFLDIHGVGA